MDDGPGLRRGKSRRAGDCEPGVAASLRRGPRSHGERFRHTRPTAHASRVAGVAHAGVRQVGLKLKQLHRLIMTSAVYLQESGFDGKKAKIDPENRLLWRQNPRRIESEVLRDSMLAVSDRLNQE